MSNNLVEKKLNAIFSTLRKIEKMLEYFLGVRSKYVGIAAEKITEAALNELSKGGGLQLGDEIIPPIKIIGRNIKGKNYEIDILGEDASSRKWIIEVTTYPIFTISHAEKFYRRVEKWLADNDERPCFLLIAYEGIDHGLYYFLKDRLSKFCEEVIILDKLRSEEFLQTCLDKSKYRLDKAPW